MRTLSPELLAAQRSASAEPLVEVAVENSVAGMRRLDLTLLDSTAQPIAKHDVGVAGDGSVTRVRMESGVVKQQRVTNPAVGPWTAWSNLSSGMGAQVACAAKSARVTVVYVDAAGTGIKLKESLDNGATYGAEQAITTAAASVVDLAVAYKTAGGDLAIAWVTATGGGIIKRTSGVFGAAATASPGVGSFNGLAMTFGFDWDMVVTGVEATTLKPSLWTLIYGDGNDAALNTWGALTPQQQAESDASVTYRAPSIAFTDTYRINVVEADAFTGGATRVYRTSVHPAMSFAAGPFTLRAPVPVNYGGVEGLAIAADAGGGGFVYESAADAIYRAPQSQVLATLTTSVLAADIDERGDATRGYIDIDNSNGALAGPPPPIAAGNLVAVSWGYRTAAGAPSSRMADLWIAAVEHRRNGGASAVRLYVEGAWDVLRRNRQRTQVVHTADVYLAILVRIFARAGLQLTSGGVSSRALTVAPKFTVHPQTSAFEATQQALAMLADRVRMRPLAAGAITEPLASASSDYTFGAAHPLRAVRARSEPAGVSEAQAFGSGAFGEAIDYTAAAQAIGTREQQRDVSSNTGATAAATAVAHLRGSALDADAGAIIVPPNCGQEVLDVIDFSDALISAAAVKRRVSGIRWRFDRHRAIYEQELRLGPP
jgi:hypothetical protein